MLGYQVDLWKCWKPRSAIQVVTVSLARSLSKSYEHPELRCGTFFWKSIFHEYRHALLLREVLLALSYCEKAQWSLSFSLTLFYASLSLAGQERDLVTNYNHKRHNFLCSVCMSSLSVCMSIKAEHRPRDLFNQQWYQSEHRRDGQIGVGVVTNNAKTLQSDREHLIYLVFQIIQRVINQTKHQKMN